jgi:hypothetical protein
MTFHGITFPSIFFAFSGYNTGHGKRGRLPEPAGVIPRAIADVFTGIRRKEGQADVTVYCSFVQIYNEQVRSLTRKH